MKDVDKGNPSLETPEKVDEPPLPSSEGRSGAKSLLESAPALPRRPTSAQVDEDLPNGEMPEEDLPGHECSPEEAEAKGIPVAAEAGDPWARQVGSEAISAASPAGQGSDPGKAPAGRQRKLAMEEIVIRDHLGQAVGCMDALGQNQRSPEKEEKVEVEGHAHGAGRQESGSQPGPADGASGQKGALGEGPLDCEPGGHDGPEGECPTAQDPPSPSGLLQRESGSLRGQGGEPLEVGALTGGAGEEGVEQEAVPEQGAPEEEPAPPLAAAGDAPTTEPAEQSRRSQTEAPGGPESGAAEEGQGDERPGSQPEQLFPPMQETKVLHPQEEAPMPLLDLAPPPSPTQIPVMPQDPVPSLQGTKESLLDQIPFQENGGSLLDPELPCLLRPNPAPPLAQNSSSPEGKGSLSDQTPDSAQECLSDQKPLFLQGPLSSPLEMKPSRLQHEVPHLPDVRCPVAGPGTLPLREAGGALPPWSQTRTGTQAASLLDQPVPPLPEDQPLALPHIPSSWHELGEPVAQQGPELLGREPEGSLPGTIPPFTDQRSSFPAQMLSFPDTEVLALEEPPAAPQDQMARASPLPEAAVFLPSQDPPSGDDPREGPTALLDQIPPVLQNRESTPLMGQTPASSPQEADGALPDEIQAPLPSHTSPDLPRPEGSSPAQAPPTSEDQAAASPLGETPSFLEGQNSAEPPEESSDLAEQTSPPDKAQSPVSRDAPVCPNALPLSSPEALQPLPDKSEAVENQDAKASGSTSVAPTGAGEVTGVLEDLHAEKQPLLKEAQVSGDGSAGDPQSKAGASKSQVATSNQTPPNSGPRTSANTACAHQLQAALLRPGGGPEPEKGKRKSCQCCTLM